MATIQEVTSWAITIIGLQHFLLWQASRHGAPQRRPWPGPGAGRPAREEQRDRARVALRPRFRAIPAEPHLAQEAVRDRHNPKVSIHHRPVPDPRRQPYRKRPHPIHPISSLAA
jgi:hypothetical protein